MEKINWTYRVKNEEVLHVDREERNILCLTKIRKCKWYGHIVFKYCLLKHVTEGKIEEKMRRRVIRSKQLLHDLKGTRRYWKFKGETADRSLEISLWKKVWTFRKTEYMTVVVIMMINLTERC